MKILLTGSNGQLGHDFKKLFDRKNIEYIATDSKELDITNDEKLKKFFQENRGITHIINCAAYNDVDKAENDEKVWLLNAKAPKKLAEISKEIGHDLWIGLISEKYYKVKFIDEKLIYFRRHSNNVTTINKSKRNIRKKIIGRYIILKELFRRYKKLKK